jgi:hypothetical protein
MESSCHSPSYQAPPGQQSVPLPCLLPRTFQPSYLAPEGYC